MKLSDYVVSFLASHQIRHNFVVTGGAVVHLIDSTDRHPNVEPICVQHEESGAAAADGYARAGGGFGLAMTTSGPGATNLTTSICNAYFDSIPLICVTGQVARFRLKPNRKMRQRGFQETDIESVFHSICKYVKLITDPQTIRYELEKALFLATEGRPGPVILDIPDDLQRAEINPHSLHSFIPDHEIVQAQEERIDLLFKMIRQADKPILVVGAGITVSKSKTAFLRFIETLGIPVLLTWGGADLLAHHHPLNMGGLGVCGPRAGNFAVQNADLVIALGTRLSQQITGGKQELFAPSAKKVMIDIDPEELNKFQGSPFALDLAIHSDLNLFFQACEPFYESYFLDFVAWRALIKNWKKRFPLCSSEDKEKDGLLNPYVFIKALSEFAAEDEIIVTDTGANICWMMQAFETKAQQKIFSAWNHTPMGYSLPASIGACLATSRPILCLIGDGGLMMCLQELATVNRYQLPIKIFIFDNQGHTTMKQTIEIWLNGRYVAVDEESGLSFPNYRVLAEAFSLPYIELKENNRIQHDLSEVWKHPGPLVCHLRISPICRIMPMLKFGSSLDQLHPNLGQEELSCIQEDIKNLYMQTV